MKTILKKPLWFLFVLPFLLGSCTKEPVTPPGIFAEINGVPVELNSGETKINIESNDIGIEFCLLNEAGEPAITFAKGENFTFHLAITNNVEPDKYTFIFSDFLRNPDLFRVFTSGGKDKGQPIEWHGMLKVYDSQNKIDLGEKWVMEIPWHETNDKFYIFQHEFKGLGRSPLPRGNYYTKITQQFCLGRGFPNIPVETICTDTLTLRINFEIK